MRAAPEPANAAFWCRHARLGVALSLATIAVLGVYAAVGTTGDRRRHILVTAVAATAVTLLVAAVVPRVVGRSWNHGFFYSWSALTILLLLTGMSVDGGVRSPIAVALYLPLIYAALAYPAPAVLVLGGLEVAGYVVVAATDGTPHRSGTGVFVATLVLSSFMAARAAANRDAQRRMLLDLTTRLRAQATHDPLTGCLNRRGFDDAADAEIARARRYDRPLALLLLDVDGLKGINDRLGHAAGDRALSAVAKALRSVSRRSDVVARLGGDEFAVVAAETGVAEAAELAGRLHAHLHTTADGMSVTVSVGVAAWHPSDEGLADLLRHADDALYDAKTRGRNRTAVHRRRLSGQEVPTPRQRDAGNWA